MSKRTDKNEPGAQPDLSHGLPGPAEGYDPDQDPDVPTEINDDEDTD